MEEGGDGDSSQVSSIQTSDYKFGPWTFSIARSHILQSQCQHPPVCKTSVDDGVYEWSNMCRFCQFDRRLSIPQLPDMVFADNVMRIEHNDGFGIEFNSLDALSFVENKKDVMKVAMADAWREARVETSDIQEVVKPFDWTYTTAYKGTLTGSDKKLKEITTEEEIDIEKLKQKEKILFYEDVHLYEDELADNGCAQLSVKVRVMPSSFFVLQRFYLRVDGVLVRVNDTRLYHEVDKNYLLREYSRRESRFEDLKLPQNVINEPSEVWMHLPVMEQSRDKLELPE